MQLSKEIGFKVIQFGTFNLYREELKFWVKGTPIYSQ
jgi:hypothetical protein